MNQKVVIETAREIRNVYTAEFSQEALEKLAACFVANQMGFDIDSPNVRLKVDTGINPSADKRRRVTTRLEIFVTEPMDAEGHQEAAGEAQAPSMQDLIPTASNGA